MDSFRAYRIDEENGKIVAGFEELTVDDLTEGNVVVRVSHSTINYKDALAATGKARILRRYPLNGGIDLAGVVIRSEDEEFQPGTEVLVNGCGLSETVDGGYSEIARVDNNSLVAIPDGMSAFEAMQIGTAGYTAALAIHRMEQNGQQPDGGPIVVTGATGGVGSVAIDMLAGRGYDVVALTGKANEEAYLREIGASQILLRDDLDLGKTTVAISRVSGLLPVTSSTQPSCPLFCELYVCSESTQSIHRAICAEPSGRESAAT